MKITKVKVLNPLIVRQKYRQIMYSSTQNKNTKQKQMEHKKWDFSLNWHKALLLNLISIGKIHHSFHFKDNVNSVSFSNKSPFFEIFFCDCPQFMG